MQDVYPSACEVVGTDPAACLAFSRFPERHWRRLRTSNPPERTFREVRRRTRATGRFPDERAALIAVLSRRLRASLSSALRALNGPVPYL